MDYKKTLTDLLKKAGVEVGGNKSGDIVVKEERFYKRAITEGSLGLGESYMDGWWESEHIDEFISKVLQANLRKYLPISPSLVWDFLIARIFNQQTRSRAKEVANVHYDLGNDLFERMLDKRMVYTCGYWLQATNLDQAQEAKLDLVCRKLSLKPGMKILDIGCGWGSFLKFAAERYGIKGVGISVSQEQVVLAKKLCEGLPVEIRLQDYRDINEQFDVIVSLGMFEHVGYKNYKEYMSVVYRCLPDHGLFLLHTIGSNLPMHAMPDPWVERYIFPNGVLPTVASIVKSIGKKFVMEDWHNFGADYDKTLLAWHDNFIKHWPEISAKYEERFYRMWRYYLLSCAGSFRSRNIQLWQVVLSKNGLPKGYKSVR